MTNKFTRWTETFSMSFLRCPKCGRGRLRQRKTTVINADSRKVEFTCARCRILIPAVSMMAKPIG